jgi:Uma2 family endonuclease
MSSAGAICLYKEPGQRITLEPVSWQRFNDILRELGNKRCERIAYAKGVLEIMTPLPEHERVKVLLADLVKILLKKQQQPWEPLGSTTLKNENMAAAIEPDDCFYIQNYQAVIGKNRIDLSVDPPPDLAIEIDHTSKTSLDAYEALGVSELWIISQGKLTIYIFTEGKYILSNTSSIFPNFPVMNIIPQFIKRSKEIGVSKTLQQFEEFI